MSYICIVNITSLNLNLLPVLDALLAERSVSRAGARVGLSQPAVSNALAQLRAHFGDPLLVRKGGGMAPTERALALAGPLRAALLALEQGLEPPAAFDPGGGRPRLHDHDQRLRRVRAAAAPARPPPARGAAACACRSAPGRSTSSRPSSRAATPTWCSGSTARPARSATTRRRCSRTASSSSRARGTRRCAGKITLATYTKLAHVLVSHEPNARGVVDDVLAQRGLHPQRRPARVALPAGAADHRGDRLRRRAERDRRRGHGARQPAAAAPEDAARRAGRATVQMVWHERTGGLAGARLAAGRGRGGGAGRRDVVPGGARGKKAVNLRDRSGGAATLSQTATWRHRVMSHGSPAAARAARSFP